MRASLAAVLARRRFMVLVYHNHLLVPIPYRSCALLRISGWSGMAAIGAPPLLYLAEPVAQT